MNIETSKQTKVAERLWNSLDDHCPHCGMKTPHSTWCETDITDGSDRMYYVCDTCGQENPDKPVYYRGPVVPGKRRTLSCKLPESWNVPKRVTLTWIVYEHTKEMDP